MSGKVTVTKVDEFVREVSVDGEIIGKVVKSLGKTDPAAPYSNGYGVDRYQLLEVNGRSVWGEGPLYATAKSAAAGLAEMAK